MPRKTDREARVERMSWFAMVMVFILLSFDENLTIPSFLIPFTIAGILLTSGIYQYLQRGWRVSPINWIVAALLIAFALFSITATIVFPVDLVLISLVGTVVVIGWGVISNES